MSYQLKQIKRNQQTSIACPHCGSADVSYGGVMVASLTCHQCGSNAVKTNVTGGGPDTNAELLKALATAGIVIVGLVAAASILEALFGKPRAQKWLDR